MKFRYRNCTYNTDTLSDADKVLMKEEIQAAKIKLAAKISKPEKVKEPELIEKKGKKKYSFDE